MLDAAHLYRPLGGIALALALLGLPAAKGLADTQFVVSGQISDLVPGSALDTVLGLSNGDPYEVTATYDETLLTNLGFEALSLNPAFNPGHSFTLNIAGIPELTFNESNDAFSGIGYPLIDFEDGKFLQFDFLSTPFNVGGTSYTASVTSDLALFGDSVAEGAVDAVGEFAVSQSFPVQRLTQ